MRRLYVMSKSLEGKPRLIGILSEDGGEYQFEYKLGGKWQEWFLRLEEFPELNRVYKGKEVDIFVSRMIPSKSSKYLKELLEGADLEEYNEWEMLKVFGQRNMREDAYLYENIPEGAILYENLDSFV